MEEFVLIMRHEDGHKVASPEQIEIWMKQTMDWIGGIAAQNKLTDRGNRLLSSGKVVKGDNVITDGPYIEMKEAIGGYSIVKAASIEEAAEIANGCPIFLVGGNVEVREIGAM